MTKAFNLKARYVMRALFCAVSITALSGCASLNLSSWTDLTSPDVDAELSRYGPPSQWSFGPGLDQEIVQDWDVIIQDERLIGLIAEALENNLSLRASAENITRAEAILTQSRSALLPSLDFSVGGDVSAPLDGFDLSDRYSSGFHPLGRLIFGARLTRTSRRLILTWLARAPFMKARVNRWSLKWPWLILRWLKRGSNKN